jgi:hypothetical protein
MRNDPLVASIGGLLKKFKRFETQLRKLGLPLFLAQLPTWLLCFNYCLMMEGKTARIARIAQRIQRWLSTVRELSAHEKARSELIDIDRGMRDDIEATKRTLLQLRELCVDIGALFLSIGFRSWMLERTQKAFLKVVDLSCDTATTLQGALEAHDNRALSILRQEQAQQIAAKASAEAHAVRAAIQPV